MDNLETQQTAGAERWGGIMGWETSVCSVSPVFLPQFVREDKSKPPADQNDSEGEKIGKNKNTATKTKLESFPCLDPTDLGWTRGKLRFL